MEAWFWEITDPITKRRGRTRYRMTEADARMLYGGGARKVESSLEVRDSTPAFHNRLPADSSKYRRIALIMKRCLAWALDMPPGSARRHPL